MIKRIKVSLNDEEYFLIKGKWYDSYSIEVPLSIGIKLTEQLLSSNLDEFSNEELEKFVMGFKDQGLTPQALRVLDVLYDRYVKAQDVYKLRWLMPVETSLLRLSHTPQQAIDFYNEQVAKFGKTIESPQLLTSIAAAHCDVRDYVNAKKLCDRAFAWGGPSYELSAVYQRIKAEY